jgi:O-antigen/teichoic acid export membrane protein
MIFHLMRMPGTLRQSTQQCRASAGPIPMRKWLENHCGGAQSLRRKALSGGGWLLGRSLVLGVIDLTRTAIFARILEAHDYGLMALVTMVTGMLTAFTFLGLDIVIQRDGEDALKRFPCYWTIKMARGIICFCMTVIIAGPVAAYYHQPQLAVLIRVASISFLIEGCGGFGKERCQQLMHFNRLVVMEVIFSIVSFALGIVAVFAFKNVWALVINQLLTTAVQFVLSSTLYPWKPSLQWNGALAKKVAIFSSSIIVINILNYFQTSFDRATIGKLFDLDTLGYYARGHFLSQIPVIYISMIIAPVFMPAFQKLNGEPQRLRAALLKVILIYSVFFIIFGALFAAGARPFVIAVYGHKWLTVVPVFRILLIYGVSKSIVSACLPIFFLKDRPWLVPINGIVMAVIFGTLCIPLTKKYGIEGTAWSLVVGAILSHVVTVLQAFRLAAQVPAGKAELR